VGANVHAENDAALRGASANGHTETVKVLLKAGADVHVWNDDALHLARMDGHTKIVKLLEAAAAKLPVRPPAAAKPINPPQVGRRLRESREATRADGPVSQGPPTA